MEYPGFSKLLDCFVLLQCRLKRLDHFTIQEIVRAGEGKKS